MRLALQLQASNTKPQRIQLLHHAGITSSYSGALSIESKLSAEQKQQFLQL